MWCLQLCVNPHKREVTKSDVEYLSQHGFATRSQSPWSSPCLLVPKSDSSYRFCTDYCKVNNITKPDSFPLPQIFLEGLCWPRWFHPLCHQIGSSKRILPGAPHTLSLVTPDNFLQYSVMAFGMRNAPLTFRFLMQQLLSGVTNCEAYLDDVVIYSANC